MCGIIGLLSLEPQRPVRSDSLASALALLQHRGPDAHSIARPANHVALGHTRLSIIDLDERSNQPMALGGRYWIVYNGEIYNYLELRLELEAAGVQLVTTGDTEVILQAYATWGEDCVRRFNGMWAFAIYDAEMRSLFCSRDRFGEKPFNYAIRDGEFIFASEINAILACRPDLAEPDYNVISNFCRTSVGAQQPQTWFSGILRLQPGHNLRVHDGRVSITRYWRYPEQTDRTLGFKAACEAYRALFLDSVALRMRSDVPLGLTLSSGLDSTSIAFAMHAVNAAPHHCFTSQFSPSDDLRASGSIYARGGCEIDEAAGAQKVAQELGLQAHVVTTSYSDLVPTLGRIVSHMGMGNSSPAVVPLFQLLQEARRHVTVLLEGQGADELLAGYVGSVLWPATLGLLGRGHPTAALYGVREFSRTYKVGYAVKLGLRQMSNEFPVFSRLQQRLAGIDAVFGPELASYNRIKDYPELPEDCRASLLAQTLRQQHSGGLVNLLHYGDSVSMAHSLESRLPFTDHRLVELVWSLPDDFKLKDGVGKHIHREAMRGLVPDRILDDLTKFGFSTPISNQFMGRNTASEDPVEALLGGCCLERGLFEEKGLRRLVDAHRTRRHDHGPLLFRLLSVEMWFREFIDGAAGWRSMPRPPGAAVSTESTSRVGL